MNKIFITKNEKSTCESKCFLDGVIMTFWGEKNDFNYYNLDTIWSV